MSPNRRQSIIFCTGIAFAIGAAVFFAAIVLCTGVHGPDAVLTLGPLTRGSGGVSYSVLSAYAGGLALAAAIAGLLVGGWRTGAANILLFIMLGLNIFALEVGYRTWDALSQAVPIAWGLSAAGLGTVLVLIDFGLLWAIRKLSAAKTRTLPGA